MAASSTDGWSPDPQAKRRGARPLRSVALGTHGPGLTEIPFWSMHFRFRGGGGNLTLCVLTIGSGECDSSRLTCAAGARRLGSEPFLGAPQLRRGPLAALYLHESLAQATPISAAWPSAGVLDLASSPARSPCRPRFPKPRSDESRGHGSLRSRHERRRRTGRSSNHPSPGVRGSQSSTFLKIMPDHRRDRRWRPSD